MSYSTLGYLCGNTNGAPFSNGASPVKDNVVLLSNWGGASYANPIVKKSIETGQYQCDGKTTFKTAYSVQMNPYASSMCNDGSIGSIPR